MNKLWEGILTLKDVVGKNASTFTYCFLNYRTGAVVINQLPDTTDNFIRIIVSLKEKDLEDQIPTVVIENYTRISFHQTAPIPEEVLCFLKKYLIFSFLSLKAQETRRAISVAHFAQTLDGKIATSLGHSKWIGNKENLIHAHRMRALCDAVLIGGRTLQEDQPRLNVRHVVGADPIRIILGNPTPNFDSLLESGDAPILVLYHKPISTHPAAQYFQFDAYNNIISTQEVLTFLYKIGIQTVYIEGGTTTISQFFVDNAVDILQLHIAPMIFGSGKSGFQFPTVRLMEEAFKFDDHHFLSVGDSIMFTGFSERK